jgi:hypothetical protein
MGLGVGLMLIAVGAALAFAVHVTTKGFNLNTIGFILLGVGILGSLLSIAFWSSWGGPAGIRRRTITTEERGA